MLLLCSQRSCKGGWTLAETWRLWGLKSSGERPGLPNSREFSLQVCWSPWPQLSCPWCLPALGALCSPSRVSSGAGWRLCRCQSHDLGKEQSLQVRTLGQQHPAHTLAASTRTRCISSTAFPTLTFRSRCPELQVHSMFGALAWIFLQDNLLVAPREKMSFNLLPPDFTKKYQQTPPAGKIRNSVIEPYISISNQSNWTTSANFRRKRRGHNILRASRLVVEGPYPAEVHSRSIQGQAKRRVSRGRWPRQSCTALDCSWLHSPLAREQSERPNSVHLISDCGRTGGFHARMCQTTIHIAQVAFVCIVRAFLRRIRSDHVLNYK